MILSLAVAHCTCDFDRHCTHVCKGLVFQELTKCNLSRILQLIWCGFVVTDPAFAIVIPLLCQLGHKILDRVNLEICKGSLCGRAQPVYADVERLIGWVLRFLKPAAMN